MEVFQIHADADGDLLLPEDEVSAAESLLRFDGTSLSADWSPLPVIFDGPRRGSDFVWLASHIPCCSIEAWNALESLVGKAVEPLPLACSGADLVAWNVVDVVDALDELRSEVEYFEGVTGSTANADVAWQPFMLGHPAWFHSAPGQALLQALHAAA